MNIKSRLVASFAGTMAFILIVTSVLIYVFQSGYRTEDFHQRMINKGTNAAKLLIKVDEVDASMLRRIEKGNPTNLFRERIAIFNYKNELLYSSDTLNDPRFTNELLDAIRLKGEVTLKGDSSETIGFLFTDRYDRFVVLVSAYDIFGLAKLKNLRRILLYVNGFAIVLILLAGWLFANQALKPLNRVVSEVESIGFENLYQRVDVGNGKDEIARLAIAFNHMLDRLERAFKSQKSFISNASHELRTPLTIISGEIEVLLRKERSADDYRTTLSSVRDEVQVLSKAANQLLMLAQTDNELPRQSMLDVRMDELVWTCREDVQKRYPKVVVDVVMNQDEGEAFEYEVHGNPNLLRTLVGNLMENAAKYSIDQRMTVRLSSGDDHFQLEVVNHPGDHELATRELFNPFYRGANSAGQRGHGLGLSLVKNIAERHGGSIQIDLKANEFRVVLNLPHQV